MSEYGLDYAMYRHDIERLERVYLWDQDKEGDNEYKNMVNVRINQGWKALSLHSENDSQVAIMGVPRPKLCTGDFNGVHDETVKVYHLRDDEWHCPICLEREDEDKPLEAF